MDYLGLKPCMPGYNKPRAGLARVRRGEIRSDNAGNEWLICFDRSIRDGSFGSHHLEFYVMRMKPITGQRNEAWIPEYLIQENTKNIR